MPPPAEIPASEGNPFGRFGNLSPTLARAAFAWGVGQTTLGWVRKARQKAAEATTYTVKVQGTDDLFPDLHEWMLSLLDPAQQRALIAATGGSGGFARLIPVDDPGQRREQTVERVRLRYDSSRRQTVILDGHRVTVELERDESRNFERLPDNWQALSQRMVFTSKSTAGRDAILAHLDGLLERKRKTPGPPPMRMSDRWGSGWDRRDDLPPRPLDSVILKAGQLERLVGDLGEFLTAEADYNRRSLPWHRGYLFHGVPGTGKTSVAKALAHHFDLPVYYLPLGDLKEDAELVRLVCRVEPRSMLILEDVDIFHAATQRDDEGKVTLSALLNALDGIWTPHGLVTVLTTNDRDALDPALIRPGRVDLDEEFTVLDEEQATRMVDWFYDDTCAPLATRSVGRSPAEMIGAMSRAKLDPGAATDLLVEVT